MLCAAHEAKKTVEVVIMSGGDLVRGSLRSDKGCDPFKVAEKSTAASCNALDKTLVRGVKSVPNWRLLWRHDILEAALYVHIGVDVSV